MKNTPARKSNPTPTLRQRAERAVRATRTEITRMSPDEIQRLVHELQVHQIELEMQNEELRVAQAELTQSRDRFNDLYDFAPVGYVTLDEAGTVTEANLTAARMLGVARRNLLGRKFTRFVAHAAQDTFYLHQRAVLGRGKNHACELRLKGPEGREFFARMESVAFRDPATGDSRHIRSALSDIAALKEAQEILARSHAKIEQRNAQLRDSERTAIAVVNGLSAHIAIVDASGRILSVNARWREFAKMNRGSLAAVGEGANYFAVCARAARRKCPGAAEVAAGIRSVLKGKLPEFVAEYPCHSPTEERWFIVRVTPFPGEGPRRVVIAHENITARVLAEQAVRREQEFSERVSHTVRTIVLVLSPEGKIIRFNRYLEEISGWSQEEARGRDWFDTFLPARDRARIRKMFRRALRGPRTSGNINPIVTKDGCELEIEWDDAPLKDAKGRLVGLLCSGRDITERRRAEAALRESEMRYRQLVHGLPISLYACDLKGRITLHNAAAAALWGRSPRPRDRWTAAERLFTEDGRPLARTGAVIAQALREGEPIRGHERIVERPDGSRAHTLIFADPLVGPDGEFTGALAMTVDITALKVAENALRTSERNMRKLSRAVEQSPSGVVITSRSGEFEYVNPKFTEVTGYALEELRGKTPRVLKSGAHPDALYQEMWATLAAGRDWRSQVCNRKKNGELYWAFVVIAPILDERGEITHFVALQEDITERRQAAAEIQDREERLRAILNTVQDAIITFDRRGTITGVNPATARMFGYTQAEIVGQNVSLLMPSPHREEHDGFLARYERTGEARIIGIGREASARRKDGTVFPVELAVSEVDHLHLFTGVIRDITRRRRLEAEVLRIAEGERQRVAADLHDGICQELMGIQYLAILLLRELEKSRHPLVAQARRIEEAVIAATEHTRQTARGLSPVVGDGHGLMHALRTFVGMTARQHRVHCTFHCPKPVLVENQIAADQLYRIAQEAVLNAHRHGHARRISVRLTENGDGLLLAIRDNGAGLPAEVEAATGMGLRVMHYRARLIGGELVVQRRRGGGTEVVCRLPEKAIQP